jgi:uncharacterized protein YaiE (UPF0345 family)
VAGGGPRDAAAASKFDLKIIAVTDYCCSYLPG